MSDTHDELIQLIQSSFLVEADKNELAAYIAKGETEADALRFFNEKLVAEWERRTARYLARANELEKEFEWQDKNFQEKGTQLEQELKEKLSLVSPGDAAAADWLFDGYYANLERSGRAHEHSLKEAIASVLIRYNVIS